MVNNASISLDCPSLAGGMYQNVGKVFISMHNFFFFLLDKKFIWIIKENNKDADILVGVVHPW